jgi:hypothetical protein
MSRGLSGRRNGQIAFRSTIKKHGNFLHHFAWVVDPVYLAPESRGARQVIGIPSYMLSGDANATPNSMVAQHRCVMFEDNITLGFDRGRRRCDAGV